MQLGDRVQFTRKYQHLLYAKGYEHALYWWTVTDMYEDERVKVEAESVRKSVGYLIVPVSALTTSSHQTVP